MKAQFIYSVAALATFPIVVNAQVDADNIGKITAKKDGTAWTKAIELAPGKYSFKSAISAGTAGKKATVSILDGTTPIVADFQVTVGEAISKDFEVSTKKTVTIKVVSEAADADFIADESVVQLNFNFSKVAELLQIEYNKVTNALAAAEYTGKASEVQAYSAYYDRILAIASADYAFYAKDDEGLQAIYAGNQSVVTGLDLYSDIQDALADVLAKEKSYQLALLDGNDGLTGLNARYDLLKANGDVISYITDALTAKKTAATDARNAYDADASGANLTAAKNALKTYKDELEKEEAVKKANEDAKKNLDAALAGVYVYGSTTSYYAEALKQIDEQYTARYTDLKNELTAELAAIVGGTDYTSVAEAIVAAYNAKTANAKLTELGVKISEFKQKLTQKVSDFNTVKDQLAEVYVSYDAEDEAASELVKDAAGFLVSDGYKKAVLDAVADFLALIEANDQFATVKKLTAEAIKAKTDDIAAAKATYSAKAAIYADYKDLKAAVAAETASLNSVKDAIDKDAKDTKKLDEGVFKPTTIWQTTIWAIGGQIDGLNGQVDAHESTATAFKTDQGYTGPLAAIKKAIADLQTNALAATELYADIAGKLKAAQDLRAALLDPTKDPKVDLTALNVWSNQVTIDETMKARTPYKAFIANGDGSITVAIANLATELDAAPGKTEKLNDKADNKTNILPYLKSLSADTKKVTDGTDLMNLIKANYSADEAKFAQQKDIEEANGIRILINGKVAEFEPEIADLQTRINNKEFGNVKGALLHAEINAITAKINAAKEMAANAAATKAQLSAEYNKIKDLLTTDIATAKKHADDYKESFKNFTDRYTTLNGTTDDASTVSTVNGLNKKVAEQKAAINALAKLTADQKTALKNRVDGVKVVKSEGNPAVDVEYTLLSIKNFIETAWQNETLEDADVTKYQGIIEELKGETNKVKNHADNLNDLETQLAQIDFAAAKNAIKAKDSNEDGFFMKKLLGNAAAGECTFDYIKLKADIEADTDITSAEKNAFGDKIDDLKDVIAGLPALAETNLNKYNAAKDYYDKAPNGAVQKYNEYVQNLTNDRQTSELQRQLATLATLKEAMDGLFVVAGQHYDAGTASDADKNDIVDKFNEIKNKYEEFYNEVNYNAQVAADNKAIYDAIVAAHADADAEYATSSVIINTYKNFKSLELKNAAETAQAELQALLDYLTQYDNKVAAIQTNADDEYNGTVSPAKFDTEESYKAQFEDIKTQIQTLTQALSDKINENAASIVETSVTDYTNAIAASKQKAAKFSVDANDVPADKIASWYSTVDGLLEAINAVKDDDAKIKDLDNALKNASDANIYALITQLERTKASSQVKAIADAYGYDNYSTNLTLFGSGDDYYLFRSIYRDYIGYYGNNGFDRCINNFATYKQDLINLKAKAEQNLANWNAICDAQTAITTANNASTGLSAHYILFAAGYTVKADAEQIVADLENYPTFGVTIANSAEWKAAAEAISSRVTATYNKLFDAEANAITGLIATAREELLTYTPTGGAPDKATLSAQITAEEGNLAAAKTAVDKPTTDPAYKTKKDALLNDLLGIESNLNDCINTITTGNETNINTTIKTGLDNQVSVQQNRLDRSLDALYYSYLINIYGSWYSYNIPGSLTTKRSDIQSAINNLSSYINNHVGEMVAYKANVEAMLEDIKSDITQFEADVQTEKAKQDADNDTNNNKALADAWNDVSNAISDAQGEISTMKAQLGYYGSTDNYKNKIAKLDNQVVTANGILTAAQAEAEGKTTIQEKYNVATTAQSKVNSALDKVSENSVDIISLAQQAYIDAFIAKLSAQVIADTWTASSNYTTTDKATLSGMLTALTTSISDLRSDVEYPAMYHAEDISYWWGTDKGVITTLNEGEAKFNADLAALKQAVKDMSLAEEVKGHIVEGNDEISTDDMEALADIILNAEEDAADLERCDISGDGEIDVTDLVWLRYYLVHGDWPSVGSSSRGDMANDYIDMQIVSSENNVTRIAVNLDNETVFNHFQLNVLLPEGAKVVGQSLGERVEGANLMMAQNGTMVRMLAVSTANNVFAGNEGAVVYIDIENLNGEVNIEKAIFTDTELKGHVLTANSTTGITQTITNALESAGQKIYNLGGKMMNGLKKGINIIRNADGSTTKVMK